MAVRGGGSIVAGMGIKRMYDMPAGTLGFRVTDEVEREDYDDVLEPALRGAIDAGAGLRTLYLIEDLDEIEGEAFWADAKLGYNVGIRERDAWVRSAIVTDIGWMARAAKVFLWMIPGEAKVYPRAELEQAKAWVAGAD